MVNIDSCLNTLTNLMFGVSVDAAFTITCHFSLCLTDQCLIDATTLVYNIKLNMERFSQFAFSCSLYLELSSTGAKNPVAIRSNLKTFLLNQAIF